SIQTVDGFEESELLRLAASLERASEHALAEAIVAGAQTRGLSLANVEAFQAIPGKGVRGRVEGREVVLGNRTLLDELKLNAGDLQTAAEALRSDGQTNVFISLDDKVAGIIALTDPIKPTTYEAVRQLQQEQVRIVMVTGDSRTTAESVAAGLQLDEVVAGVLPEQKLEVVKRF